MNKKYLIGGLILIGVLSVFMMVQKPNESDQKTIPTQVEKTTNAPVDEAVKEFTLEAGSFYYKPNEIRVKKGDKVKVTINSVSMMHDFVIDELNVRTPIVKNGDSGSVEFIADKTGTFEFYCSVGQHRANGQIGTLIIEE